MFENESELVTKIALVFFERLFEIDSSWEKAFFRFAYDQGASDSTSSYIRTNKEVLFFGVFENSDHYDLIGELFEKLFNSLKKEKGVALIVVDRNKKFEIFFEFKKLNRWKITKLNGHSGIPLGFEDEGSR